MYSPRAWSVHSLSSGCHIKVLMAVQGSISVTSNAAQITLIKSSTVMWELCFRDCCRGGTEEKTTQLSLNAGSTKGALSKLELKLNGYPSPLNWDLKNNFLPIHTQNHKDFSETWMHPDNLKNKSWSQAKDWSKILINMPCLTRHFTKYIHWTTWRMAV